MMFNFAAWMAAALVFIGTSANAQEQMPMTLSRSSHTEIFSKAVAPTVAWTPVVSLWNCGATQDGVGCGLQAYGPPPAGYTDPAPTAVAWVPVRAGIVRGSGKLLALLKTVLSCTTSAGYLFCQETTPSLMYGAGVQLFSADAGSPPSANLYVPGMAPAPVFDFDRDGALTDQDIFMLIRFLAGQRGSPLVQGINLRGGATAETVASEAQLVVLAGLVHFSGEPFATATRDGLIAMRCVRGLRDNALVAGATTRSLVDVTAHCNSLVAVN